jgi:DNA invertase Pin-like site-specific DNA recombinase
MPKAYSYVRWSTPEQAHGGTLERQLKLSREYAAKHNLDLDESYIDPGVSAYRGKNRFEGALANFISAVKTGKIPKGSYLLVESLDRLSRDKVLKALSLFISIIEAGITIVSLLDEQVYSAEDMERTPGMIMMSIGVMMRANDESKVKSRRKQEDVDKKLREAREQKTPITAMCPSWLRLVKRSNGKREYERIPERVAIVCQIYLDAVAGLGAVQITARLNQGHYSADGNPTPAFRGKDGWHPSSVKKILSNLAVLGFYQPHHIVDGKRVELPGEPIELYPQIIEPELFWRTRKAIEERRTGAAGRTGNGYPNLFKGLGYCQCGAKLRYVDKGPPPKGGNYLVCSASLRRHRCKNRTGFPYEQFEKIMIQDGPKFVAASHLSLGDTEGAAARRVGELQTALAGKRTLRRRLLDTFDDDPDDLELQDKARQYRTEIKQLEAELSEARKTANQEQYVRPS